MSLHPSTLAKPVKVGKAFLPSILRRRLAEALPIIVVGPLLFAVIAYVVGFTLWTVWLSFTDSTILPQYELVGLHHYTALLSTRLFQVAYANLVIYGLAFIVLTTGVGLFLAILVNQRIRAENLWRTVFLY